MIAELLNARLLALRGSDEGQPGLPHKLWGGLRVALSTFVHALTHEGVSSDAGRVQGTRALQWHCMHHSMACIAITLHACMARLLAAACEVCSACERV